MSDYIPLPKISFNGKCSYCGKKGKYQVCGACWEVMLASAANIEKLFDRCAEHVKINEEKTGQHLNK